jgi:uncharacterized protein (DUF983 family)
MNNSASSPPHVSPYVAGLTCKCPRCGKGKLYAGLLSLRPNCEKCGLDFGFIDAGDGPAIFVILIMGFAVTGAVLFVELNYEPPFIVHALLWTPVILILIPLSLRLVKSLLIALQFHHKAGEGRLIDRDKP